MPVTDYQNLIDAPTWAFIRKTESCYPPDSGSQSLADQRKTYDAMAQVFHQGYPPGVTAKDSAIAGVPCRVYHGAAPTVVYLHGGGFILGGLLSHDDVCAEICHHTGLQVVSVDYRLAPEHPHPAAYDDALAVTRTLAKGGRYLLVGDSAGAALAASVAHTMRHSQTPAAGAVLIYPGLGGSADQGSYLTHANAPMLTTADVAFYGKARYADGRVPTKDPTAAALQDDDFSNLPATVIFSAECDPLADDGRIYTQRITAAGGSAIWHLETGLVHGYLRARHSVPRAAASFKRILTAIATLGRQP